MSQNKQQYPTGVYVRGDSVQVAASAARAVALVFDGYTLRESDTKVKGDSVVAPQVDDGAEKVTKTTTKKSDNS